jgi:hypothetical protein
MDCHHSVSRLVRGDGDCGLSIVQFDFLSAVGLIQDGWCGGCHVHSGFGFFFGFFSFISMCSSVPFFFSLRNRPNIMTLCARSFFSPCQSRCDPTSMS